MVGVNFGRTIIVENEEELQKELKRNAPKDPEKVAKMIQKLVKEDRRFNTLAKKEVK